MPAPIANRASKIQSRVGGVLSVLMVLFLAMDAIVKFVNPPPVIEASKHLGLPAGEAFILGVILLLCTALYAVPPTSVLGAILLTGYLGGAVATQLRVNEPLFNMIFPVLMGVALWGGLYLRDARLRNLIPLRSNSKEAA